MNPVSPVSSPSNPLKVADHFPTVLRACQDVAGNFFQCFGQYAFVDPNNKELPDRGQIALKECHHEMKAYDTCMKKHLPKFQAYQAKLLASQPKDSDSDDDE